MLPLECRMICPTCHGTPQASPFCSGCGGSGIAYYCEADKESLIPLPDTNFDWEALQRLRKSSGY